MKYQASLAGKVDEYEELFTDVGRAADAIEVFEADNCAIKKFQKKSIPCWDELKKVFGTRKAKQKIVGCEPYEEEEWIRKMNNEKGWPRSECKRLWDDFKSSGLYTITYTGLNGVAEM